MTEENKEPTELDTILSAVKSIVDGIEDIKLLENVIEYASEADKISMPKRIKTTLNSVRNLKIDVVNRMFKKLDNYIGERESA